MKDLIKAKIVKLVFDKSISTEKKAKKLNKIYNKFMDMERPAYMNMGKKSLMYYESLVNIAHGQHFGKIDTFSSVTCFDNDIDAFCRIIEFNENKKLLDKYF